LNDLEAVSRLKSTNLRGNTNGKEEGQKNRRQRQEGGSSYKKTNI
jgi:hypothetical protein